MRKIALLTACTAATLLLACQGAALRDAKDVDGAGTPPETPARTFYVSRTGDGSDGKSWATAWTELNRIQWDLIGPGDLILIDGGKGSMTYETTLTLEKSGVAGRPIVIRAATEEGHDGTVVIHGGRKAPLPECGTGTFDRQQDSELRLYGINTNGQGWVYIDGARWNGLKITGHNGPGVEVTNDSLHLTFKHLDVVDNGSAAWRSDGSWYPFGTGVRAGGKRILFERSQIHDNGGDGIRVEGGLENFVLRRSWVFNARPHSSVKDEPFNWCAQPDGVHVAPVGGDMSGFTVQDSIIGPGWTNGMLLADAKVLGDWGVFHDVLIENTVLVAHHGPTAASNLTAMQPPGHAPRNWKLTRVTSIRDPGAKFANIAVRGKGHILDKSLFIGGEAMHLEDPQVTNTCKTPGVTGPELGLTGTPLLVDTEFAGVGEAFAAFDLRFDDRSECKGLGASVTSPEVLMSDEDLGTDPAIIPNVPPEISFLTPTADTQPIADEPIAVTAVANDPDGEVTRVEFYAGAEMIGGVDFAPFTLTWRPPEGTHTLVARAFDEDGGMAETTVSISTVMRPKVTFEAEDMALSNGMSAANGCISHGTSTFDPNAGGQATYDFTLSTPGTYVIKGLVTAPSTSANSFFVNVNANPTTAGVWDLGITSGFEEQTVKWRGGGTETNPEFAPKTFQLDAGTHQLVIRGREAGSCLDRLTIELLQ